MNRYISDMHLGHANVLRFDHRPFADVEEMERYMINKWQDTVQKDDAVWKYINNMNASCEKNVGEAYEQWQKDLKRTAEKNTWMRQLLESLDNFEYADSDKDIER